MSLVTATNFQLHEVRNFGSVLNAEDPFIVRSQVEGKEFSIEPSMAEWEGIREFEGKKCFFFNTSTGSDNGTRIQELTDETSSNTRGFGVKLNQKNYPTDETNLDNFTKFGFLNGVQIGFGREGKIALFTDNATFADESAPNVWTLNITHWVEVKIDTVNNTITVQLDGITVITYEYVGTLNDSLVVGAFAGANQRFPESPTYLFHWTVWQDDGLGIVDFTGEVDVKYIPVTSSNSNTWSINNADNVVEAVSDINNLEQNLSGDSDETVQLGFTRNNDKTYLASKILVAANREFGGNVNLDIEYNGEVMTYPFKNSLTGMLTNFIETDVDAAIDGGVLLSRKEELAGNLDMAPENFFYNASEEFMLAQDHGVYESTNEGREAQMVINRDLGNTFRAAGYFYPGIQIDGPLFQLPEYDENTAYSLDPSKVYFSEREIFVDNYAWDGQERHLFILNGQEQPDVDKYQAFFELKSDGDAYLDTFVIGGTWDDDMDQFAAPPVINSNVRVRFSVIYNGPSNSLTARIKLYGDGNLNIDGSTTINMGSAYPNKIVEILEYFIATGSNEDASTTIFPSSKHITEINELDFSYPSGAIHIQSGEVIS